MVDTTLSFAEASFAPLKRPSLRLFAQVRLWLDVWSERRQLAELNDAALCDVGLSAPAAAHETARAAWDITTRSA